MRQNSFGDFYNSYMGFDIFGMIDMMSQHEAQRLRNQQGIYYDEASYLYGVNKGSSGFVIPAEYTKIEFNHDLYVCHKEDHLDLYLNDFGLVGTCKHIDYLGLDRFLISNHEKPGENKYALFTLKGLILTPFIYRKGGMGTNFTDENQIKCLLIDKGSAIIDYKGKEIMQFTGINHPYMNGNIIHCGSDYYTKSGQFICKAQGYSDHIDTKTSLFVKTDKYEDVIRIDKNTTDFVYIQYDQDGRDKEIAEQIEKEKRAEALREQQIREAEEKRNKPRPLQRNDKCSCGSGKKYKDCCLKK